MHVKGSPSASAWCGVDSIPNTPGFIILPGLPTGFPAPKRPTGYQIPNEYLTRIKSDRMKEFCVLEGKGGTGAAYADLIKMAETLVLPSRTEVSQAEFGTLSRHQKLSMTGYGCLEVIGDGYCPYIVPFIRDRLDFHNEVAFWALPGQPGAGGGMPAPIGLPSQPRVEPPVPFVQYAVDKAARDKTARRAKAATRRANRKPTNSVSDQGASESEEETLNKRGKRKPTQSMPDRSASESEDQKTPTATKRINRKKKKIPVSVSSGSEAEEPKTPKAWYCTMDECHVGTFAMIESIYDDAGEERGVSLVKVTSLEAPDGADFMAIEWLTSSHNQDIKCIE